MWYFSHYFQAINDKSITPNRHLLPHDQGGFQQTNQMEGYEASDF